MSHQTISFIKSVIRIMGYLALFGVTAEFMFLAATLLVLSEFVGIVEEIGH